MEQLSSDGGRGYPRRDRNGGPYFLDQRRRAVLNELDHAEFSMFHLKVCFFAGAGFFTDAYDLFAINIVTIMLGYVYGSQASDTDPGRRLSAGQELGLKIASPLGTLFGEVVFGLLADLHGRKWMYGVELSIILLSTFVQALSGSGPFLNIIGVLTFWRFIMGIGIGGDYPLSAIISSEFAPIRSRGRFMTTVFAAQGWGQFLAALLSAGIVAALGDKISKDSSMDPRHVDLCWRLVIGLGCIPATLALYFRFTVPETPRFTMDIESNIMQATQDVNTFLPSGPFDIDAEAVVRRATPPSATLRDFIRYFSQWRNAKMLAGTTYSWFALDVVFYGLGLNNEAFIKQVLYPRGVLKDGSGIRRRLLEISFGNAIFSAGGLIPGYYASFFFIDRWGRKPIQYLGFAMLTVIFAIMGFSYNSIHLRSDAALVFLYCLANFFQNFGPNTTTFIIPGEAFPTRYRSTAYGLSAAGGKIGAIVTQVIIWSARKNSNDELFRFDFILKNFSLFTLSGIVSTFFIPETKQHSLEDISNENQERFLQGIIGISEVSEQDIPLVPTMDMREHVDN